MELPVVLFWTQDGRVGMEATQVLAARPDPEPVFSTMDRPRFLLRLRHPEREIRVFGPVELVHLPVEVIHPLPPLLAARMRIPGARALALPGDKTRQAILLVDGGERAQSTEWQ
ncbi:MAG: hypothetical protein HQL96_07830 [Magnetococcales bacterium]|nr:hypothetical protein [Magnetococcales bacterium]